MVERSAAYAAAAMGGTIVAGHGERSWRSCVLDSRRVEGGEIFFALHGEQADGHEYASQAAVRGAGAVVVHREVDPMAGEAAWIRVDDTYNALHALTRAVRTEIPDKLVALTGSVGKTTTKEILGHVLEHHRGLGRVARSKGNFNNLYGFPIALLGIDDGSEWMVAEMGMSTPGELGGVSRLGRPDVVLLLNVRAVHLENFADLRGIADAKAEILEGLAPDGTIVANADDPEVRGIVRRHRAAGWNGRLVTFSLSGARADVRVAEAPVTVGFGSRFQLTAGAEEVEVRLPLYGLYNAENALAAAATALTLDVPLMQVADALATVVPPPGRGEVHVLESPTGQLTLVDDSYNSNPDAAKKALASAAALSGQRHVAILGAMLELGPDAPEMHREVGRAAADLGFEPVIGVGELAAHLATAARGEHLPNASAAVAWALANVRDGDVVLVKGSRGVGLEVVARALIGEPTEDAN